MRISRKQPILENAVSDAARLQHAETQYGEAVYASVLAVEKLAKTRADFLAIADQCDLIAGFRDADALAQKARERAAVLEGRPDPDEALIKRRQRREKILEPVKRVAFVAGILLGLVALMGAVWAHNARSTYNARVSNATQHEEAGRRIQAMQELANASRQMPDWLWTSKHRALLSRILEKQDEGLEIEIEASFISSAYNAIRNLEESVPVKIVSSDFWEEMRSAMFRRLMSKFVTETRNHVENGRYGQVYRIAQTMKSTVPAQAWTSNQLQIVDNLLASSLSRRGVYVENNHGLRDAFRNAGFIFIPRNAPVKYFTFEVSLIVTQGSRRSYTGFSSRNDVIATMEGRLLTADGQLVTTVSARHVESAPYSLRVESSRFGRTESPSQADLDRRARSSVIQPFRDQINQDLAGAVDAHLNISRSGQQATPSVAPAVTTSRSQTRASDLASSFTNSLGMELVSVADLPGVLFCKWETRVQDYEAFVRQKPREWPKPHFQQSPTHPAVNVTWNDAVAFCEWLTEKERREGMIGQNQRYRLPKDWEWSVAVGLNENRSGSPRDKDEKTPNVYPWNRGRGTWPPPRGAGNYGQSLNVDSFANTSPVGSFDANANGLFDMGGNVWEWCDDFYDGRSGTRVLRGGSWYFNYSRVLLSSFRSFPDPGNRSDYYGFRVVLSR
jgi:hypothetical protein